MPFDETSPPKIYCTACGVPHHEDCYQENGGCTVFGCSRAPADDPKLQVSYSDLNAAAAASGQAAPARQAQPTAATPTLSPSAAVPSLPDYVQQAYAQSRQPKSRSTYIVLGIFLGALGIHNFYAGYVGRAVAQLCLSVLTLFYMALVSWIWAIVEICIVEKDSAGIRFS
jgi:TM2 domain-containing membrane protein YozV